MEEQISKMAMRKILETIFEEQACEDCHIEEVHKQWQATKEKGNRKSRNSTQQHTQRWRYG